jgi:S-DNA-T family DNA segregation ATPase FtsK/SpoIIIE
MTAAALRRPGPLRPPRRHEPDEEGPPRFARAAVIALLTSLLRRLAGVALLALGLFLALALWGFAATDPSFNQVTAAPVANPAGLAGARVADLLLQTFGAAALLLVLTALAWGLRLALDRRLAWPWLPVLALPAALLAACAFLASRAVPEYEVWPFRVGLGGFVGDYLFLALQPEVGPAVFTTGSAVLALVLGITALGLRWRVSVWFAGHVASGSRWVGRRVGQAAVLAGARGGAAMARGWRDLRGAGDGANDNATLREPDADRPGLWRRLLARLPRRPRVAEEDRAARPLPARRPLRVVAAEPVAVDPPPVRRPRPSRAAAETAAVAPAPRPLEAPQDGSPSFELPGLDLLARPKGGNGIAMSKPQLDEVSRQLETVLDDFGVRGEIIDAKPGPVVTLFELAPAPGTRAARVISLADDIARSLCALSVRVAVVPGRNVIGIELPNEQRATVYLREIFEGELFRSSAARLCLALGKDISGQPITVDLARMPHLLIAGTTGSGKSVAINAMILSLLYRLTPEQCRIIMIDPKVIELSVYEGIPHLLAPVVTEPHKAVVALKWVVRQMDERYRLMSHLGVRDIFAFNNRIRHALEEGEVLKRRVRTGFEPGTGAPIFEEVPIEMRPLPLIVVIVDEVADLMLTAGKEIENAIQRLSQKARAAGIHLIVATQRPSVDVLTGVIKANLPSRISFRVSSKIDSRTILGEPGAEQLLGQGDMLYLMPGDRIARIHGALVTDAEVERVVRHLRSQGEPDYEDSVTREDGDDGPGPDGPLFEGAAAGAGDALYQQAIQIVAKDGKASTSYLQRKLQIGYNSAAKLIERMEADGLISEADHVGRRQVLMGRGGVDGTEPTGPY